MSSTTMQRLFEPNPSPTPPRAPTQDLEELVLSPQEKELLQELQKEYACFTAMRPGLKKAELLDELRKLKRRLDAAQTTEAALEQSIQWGALLY